jgi:hypothetical protein
MPFRIDRPKNMPSSFVNTCTICGFKLTDSIHDNSTHIDLGLELRDGLHRTRSDDDLAAFHLLTLDSAEESPHIVASLALECINIQLAGNLISTYSVQLLMEHL